MKLLTKTTLFYLLLSLLAFSIGGIVALRLIRTEVQKETDYSLRDSYRDARRAIQGGAPIEALNTRKVKIDSVPMHLVTDTNFVFADTLGPHPRLKDTEPYRKLTVTKVIDGQAYRFEIQDVFLELDDSYEVVVKIMTRLFLLLGLVLVGFMFFVSRSLLSPFQETLKRIKAFNVTNERVPDFPETTTTEFQQLNAFIEQMMQQAQRDYRSLKEFSENASHEIQTPLAIARGKLEILLETPNLSARQLGLIHTTQEALARLSKTSEALLLLTRIENQALLPKQDTDLSKIADRSLRTFSELAELKGLSLTAKIDEDVKVPIEPALAEILVGNLLKNAVRHNVDEGWIRLSLTQKALTIANTGEPPSLPTDQLFQRFQTNAGSGQSLGLGLAIVKKICDVHHFDLQYTYENDVHTLNVSFQS